MSDGNEICSAQYVAHCRKCFTARSLTRAQVMTGKNPLCDHCGGAMVVYLQGADVLPAPVQQLRTA